MGVTPANTTNTLMHHVSCFFSAQDDIYDLNVHVPGQSGWRWVRHGIFEIFLLLFRLLFGEVGIPVGN